LCWLAKVAIAAVEWDEVALAGRGIARVVGADLTIIADDGRSGNTLSRRRITNCREAEIGNGARHVGAVASEVRSFRDTIFEGAWVVVIAADGLLHTTSGGVASLWVARIFADAWNVAVVAKTSGGVTVVGGARTSVVAIHGRRLTLGGRVVAH